MNDENLYDLVKTYFDRIENRLIHIEDRLRDVENHISESRGKTSVTGTPAKDVFSFALWDRNAVVLSFVRLTQN